MPCTQCYQYHGAVGCRCHDLDLSATVIVETASDDLVNDFANEVMRALLLRARIPMISRLSLKQRAPWTSIP